MCSKTEIVVASSVDKCVGLSITSAPYFKATFLISSESVETITLSIFFDCKADSIDQAIKGLLFNNLMFLPGSPLLPLLLELSQYTFCKDYELSL